MRNIKNILLEKLHINKNISFCGNLYEKINYIFNINKESVNAKINRWEAERVDKKIKIYVSNYLTLLDCIKYNTNKTPDKKLISDIIEDNDFIGECINKINIDTVKIICNDNNVFISDSSTFLFCSAPVKTTSLQIIIMSFDK